MTDFDHPSWCDGDYIIEDRDGSVLACTHELVWQGVDTTVTVERTDEVARPLRKPIFAIDSSIDADGQHDLNGLTETHVLCLIDALIKALADVRSTTVDAVLEEVRALT